MLIVFTGIRGSGKTTVAKALYGAFDSTKERYIRHNSCHHAGPLRRIGYSVYLWRFFEIQFFRMYIARALRRGLPSLYTLYTPLIFVYNLHQLQKKNTDIVVYDTDILTWPLDNNFAQDKVRKFWADSILPRARRVLIVAVDTAPEQALARWKQREGAHPPQDDEVRLAEGRARRHKTRNRAVQTVAALSNVRVVHVDGGKAPEDSAAKIVAIIASWRKENSI